MGVIAWIVLGAVAGLIAAQLTGRKIGPLLACVVGIAGALLGGFLATALFGASTLDTFFDLSTWLTAIIGAAVLLLLFTFVGGRRRNWRAIGGRRRRWRRA